MKSYPSIPGPSKAGDTACVGLVKYDGSNLRFEWSPKRGWYKFGTRRQLVDRKDPIYGIGIEIFLAKYGDNLEKLFKQVDRYQKAQSVTCFAEFFGAKSFAGMHQPNDEFDVVLFDINIHKKGFLDPNLFQMLCIAADVPGAEIKYRGDLTQEVVDSVRDETMDIVSEYRIKSDIPEGIIFKGGTGHNQWAVKVKTNRYKELLKTEYANDWSKYWE